MGRADPAVPLGHHRAGGRELRQRREGLDAAAPPVRLHGLFRAPVPARVGLHRQRHRALLGLPDQPARGIAASPPSDPPGTRCADRPQRRRGVDGAVAAPAIGDPGRHRAVRQHLRRSRRQRAARDPCQPRGEQPAERGPCVQLQSDPGRHRAAHRGDRGVRRAEGPKPPAADDHREKAAARRDAGPEATKSAARGGDLRRSRGKSSRCS